MRMLILSADMFPPFRVDLTELFGKEICHRGHRVDWILQSAEDCESSYQVEWNGGKVWVGKTDTGESSYAKLRRYFLRVRHDFRMISATAENDYDFVQVKDRVIGGLVGLLVARYRKLPFFYWLSYPYPEADLESAKTRKGLRGLLYLVRGLIKWILLYRITLKFADHVFVQSRQMQEDLAKIGINNERMTPVPMGIGERDFRQAGELFRKGSGTGTIVYLGTMIRERRLDFLLDVLEEVCKVIPEANLLFVGDSNNPSDIEHIRSVAEQKNLQDKVSITGFLPRDEAWRQLLTGDVAVSPFYPTKILLSTSPTKLIEYMALQMPVVANDHPEQCEVINESQGGLCVPWEAGAFAEAIIEILSDPARAAEMGKAGRQYVAEKRVYPQIASMLENEYFRLLGASAQTLS